MAQDATGFKVVSAPVTKAGDSFIRIKDGVAVRTNNPCNLRWSPMQAGTKDGFAYFHRETDGMLACIKEIETDAKEGHTLASLIEENTPRSENDTDRYIADLLKCIKKPADTLVSDVPAAKLAACVAKLESSTIIKINMATRSEMVAQIAIQLFILFPWLAILTGYFTGRSVKKALRELAEKKNLLP